MVIKKRIKQYFNMLLVAIVLGTTIFAIPTVNAETYLMDGENSTNTTISVGMYLDGSDSIQISSNLHTHIYISI
ncbi:MAG TPA: hypothetical protein PLV83_03750 [Bacilli bacterium]|nr:hypothetical protein [Bacilli bacterium]